MSIIHVYPILHQAHSLCGLKNTPVAVVSQHCWSRSSQLQYPEQSFEHAQDHRATQNHHSPRGYCLRRQEARPPSFRIEWGQWALQSQISDRKLDAPLVAVYRIIPNGSSMAILDSSGGFPMITRLKKYPSPLLHPYPPLQTYIPCYGSLRRMLGRWQIASDSAPALAQLLHRRRDQLSRIFFPVVVEPAKVIFQILGCATSWGGGQAYRLRW